MPYPAGTLYPSGGALPVADGDVRPTLDELAQLLYARTKDKVTGAKGAWTANTSPTETGASKCIDQATAETLARWPTLQVSLWPLGRQVTLYKAALLVEQSYYPEMVGGGDSTVRDELYADWERFSRELTALSSKRSPRSRIGSVRVQSRSDEWREANGLIESTSDWDLDGEADA